MNFNEKYPDTEIRALSWKQPFASLMLCGKIETRIWSTPYRGLVLICAPKAVYSESEILHIAGNKQYGRIHTIGPLEPTGQAIAIGRLVDSRFMTKEDEDRCFVEYYDPWLHTSKKTGKKSWKRLWCHVYEDIQPIQPFEWHGSQGWKKLDDEAKDKIIFI